MRWKEGGTVLDVCLVGLKGNTKDPRR